MKCKVLRFVNVLGACLMTSLSAQAMEEIHFINCGEQTSDIALLQTEQIQAWESKNPNYRVRSEYIPWGECQNKVLTLAFVGMSPDLAYIGSRTLRQLSNYGLIVPFDLSESDKNSYETSVLSTVSFDDQVWGIPRAFSSKALFWNKSLFEQAGLPIDKAPENWEELLAAAKAITENTEAAGIGIPAAEFNNTMHEWLNWVYSNGGQIVDVDGNVTFNSPEIIEALQLMADLAPYMEEEPLIYTRDDLAQLFAEQKIAMYTNGSWGRVSDLLPNTADWGTALIPKGPSGDHSTLLITDSLVAFDTKHSEMAKNLIEFLTSDKNQVDYDDIRTTIPIRKGQEVDALVKEDPSWAAFITPIPVGGPEPLIADYASTQSIVNRAIQDVILGDKTPEEVAARAAEALEAIK